jgi:hypothetical protein
MNSNQINRCPGCGQAISQGVRGLCPACLALVAFAPDEASSKTISSTRGGNDALANVPSSPALPLLSLDARFFGNYDLLEEIARAGNGSGLQSAAEKP